MFVLTVILIESWCAGVFLVKDALRSFNKITVSP